MTKEPIFKHLQLKLEPDKVQDTLQTICAVANIGGGTITLIVNEKIALARFFRELDAEISPKISIQEISTKEEVGKFFLRFRLIRKAPLYKVRSVGKFIRKKGKNIRLSIRQQNQWKKLYESEQTGQTSLFDEIHSTHPQQSDSDFKIFSTDIDVSRLFPEFAEILEQLYEPKDIFISYSHEDYSVVNKIKEELLLKTNLSIWIDERVMGPGAVILSEIASGIGQSKLGIVMISAASKKSYWVQREISMMHFHRRFKDPFFTILPVRLDSIELPESLTEFLAYSIITDQDIIDLIEQIENILATKQPYSPNSHRN